MARHFAKVSEQEIVSINETAFFYPPVEFIRDDYLYRKMASQFATNLSNTNKL